MAFEDLNRGLQKTVDVLRDIPPAALDAVAAAKEALAAISQAASDATARVDGARSALDDLTQRATGSQSAAASGASAASGEAAAKLQYLIDTHASAKMIADQQKIVEDLKTVQAEADRQLRIAQFELVHSPEYIKQQADLKIALERAAAAAAEEAKQKELLAFAEKRQADAAAAAPTTSVPGTTPAAKTDGGGRGSFGAAAAGGGGASPQSPPSVPPAGAAAAPEPDVVLDPRSVGRGGTPPDMAPLLTPDEALCTAIERRQREIYYPTFAIPPAWRQSIQLIANNRLFAGQIDGVLMVGDNWIRAILGMDRNGIPNKGIVNGRNAAEWRRSIDASVDYMRQPAFVGLAFSQHSAALYTLIPEPDKTRTAWLARIKARGAGSGATTSALPGGVSGAAASSSSPSGASAGAFGGWHMVPGMPQAPGGPVTGLAVEPGGGLRSSGGALSTEPGKIVVELPTLTDALRRLENVIGLVGKTGGKARTPSTGGVGAPATTAEALATANERGMIS